MISRLIAAVSSLSLIAGAALAQPDFGKFDPRDEMEERMERGDDHPPMLILGPPEDFKPPGDMPEMNPQSPEEAKRMVAKMFFRFMDRSGDGVLDFDEFGSWIRDLAFPGGMPRDMDDGGRRRDDDRDQMDDEGRKEDDRAQMDDEEDGRGNENPKDMARRKRDEARRRIEEKAQGRMDGEDDHPENEDDGEEHDGEEHDGEEMDHKDDGDRRGSGKPMDMARRKMDDARKRMEQTGGDMKDHMEEEGREHMEEMMMDGFDKSMHPDLAKLPDAPQCSDDLRERELKPQKEGVPCGDLEAPAMPIEPVAAFHR